MFEFIIVFMCLTFNLKTQVSAFVFQQLNFRTLGSFRQTTNDKRQT
jgi:hypothetical protein